MFSNFLNSRHDLCKELVNRLLVKFEYVSILGKHIKGTSIEVTSFDVNIGDTFEAQCGFVVRFYNGKCFSEYSFSDITKETIDHIEQEIINKTKLDEDISAHHIEAGVLDDEPLVQTFSRELEGELPSPQQVVEKLQEYKGYIHNKEEKISFVELYYELYETSSFFISKNRDLKQNFGWNIVGTYVMSKDGQKMQSAYKLVCGENPSKNLIDIKDKLDEAIELAVALLDAGLIEPGVYDIITNPSITGLIAHEAFGHGVEMDMFVKQRAKARMYVNKPVASPLVNMHDGASATRSCASYFFDDDGVLAHDTLIIEKGILRSGICDAISGRILNFKPTGNGRRQDPSRKAYTRMTNTFFEPGKDKLEDMIASIKHGYMLCDTSNGMEDPKNWQIQCVAQYGREIKDGKFTGKIVAPVVMSGYVPDLLMSISMISDDFEVIGSGHCGKGHKEWVTVSDGGPCLKARCKLG